jgi:chaperonin GroEL
VTGVVFQPTVSEAMSSGADALVNAIKPTLGPLARTVLIERGAGRHVAPDILRDSGTIVRRLIALPDENADVGAMLLRHALWRVHERAGDGVATCAVLFQAIVQQARRYVAAGGNAMQMRSGILRAAEAACDALHQQAEPLDGAHTAMHCWVAAHCDDAPLAETIAQILATTGADSSIMVENAQSTKIEHEFIRGAFFKTGWQASPFAPHEANPNRMLRLPDAHVLVSDLDLSDPAHMEPLVMALTQLKPPRLMIVCRKSSAQLQTLFVQARQKGIGDVVFVQPPTVSGPDRLALLSDMALLVGATFIPHVEESGARTMMNLADLLPTCLGRADVAWASEHFAGIEGGRGAQAAQVAHLGKLDAALQAEEQPERIKFYQERIAAFGSGTTRLKVGAHTDSEQKQRKAQAERAVRLATQANRFGVVPGAGMALLLCEKAVRKAAAQSANADARMGAECVVRALTAPMYAIAENAGLEGASIVARNRTAKRGWGFDVLVGCAVNLRKSGLLDSAFALETALRTAASAAATFITTDVIVHRRQTEAALRP